MGYYILLAMKEGGPLYKLVFLSKNSVLRLFHNGGRHFMSMIKVLLVEDDPVWSHCIKHLLSLENDISIIATTAEKTEAMTKFQEADIVLMDINLTGNNLDGLDLAFEMKKIKATKIIMLTVLTDKDIILKAFTVGAIYYLSKTNFQQLPHTIRSVMKDSSSLEILLKDYQQLRRNNILQALTPAERDVFNLIEQGLSVTKIGKKLFKSESTIKNQISNILKKMNAKTCKQALESVKF
ncbi:Transcriptional regulatory protein LiaR [compost metagenome]